MDLFGYTSNNIDMDTRYDSGVNIKVIGVGDLFYRPAAKNAVGGGEP